MNSSTIQLSESDIFALYSLPNDQHHYLIQQKGTTILPFKKTVFEQEGFVFHPFVESKKYPSILISKDIFIKNPKIHFASNHKKKVTCINEMTYLKTVEQFILQTQTNFKKLIFSRIKPVHVPTDNLFPLFLALKNQYSNAFVYLVNIPEIGCWMGASPEVFLHKTPETVKSVALAGTQRDLGLPLEKVRWEEKEIEEQAIVTRYIEKTLEREKIPFQKTNPFTAKAGNVLHLKTAFKFSANSYHYELLKALHPTPAVCGLPKEDAESYITAHEAHDRAYYCGFLGPANIHKSSNLFVNLRCMQVFENQFALYVGGGITADSIAENEWEETEMKAQTLANVIQSVLTFEAIL